MSDEFAHTIGRLTYLMRHEAFRRTPLRVAARCTRWEWIRRSGTEVCVPIHNDCVMVLRPCRRGYGLAGLVYCFRDLYEPSVQAAILRFVSPGSTAYDVGANIGLWSLLMGRRVGEHGRVCAFEPIPESAALLRINLGLSNVRSVRVIELALGAVPATTRMYVPHDAGRASMAPETTDDEVIETHVTTLDDFWRGDGKPKVDFIKLDAEGSEPRILTGGVELFDVCRPIVTCEVNSDKLRPLGHHRTEIFDYFRNLGYEPRCWNSHVHCFIPLPQDVDGDILFLPAPS